MAASKRKRTRDQAKALRLRERERVAARKLRERGRAAERRLRQVEARKLFRQAEREIEKSQQLEISRCRKYHRNLKFLSAKRYARELTLWITSQDDCGRNVGLSYDAILELVRERFPIITYTGPHKDQPIKMSVKQLREIAYVMQGEDRGLRFPVRPRSKRQKQKGIAATIIRPKVSRASRATITRRKG